MADAADMIDSRENCIKQALLWESEVGRTVLFSDLPNDLTEDDLVVLLQPAGEVEQVVIMPHHSGPGDVALVLMQDREAAVAVVRHFRCQRHRGRRLHVGYLSMRDHQVYLYHLIQQLGLDEVLDVEVMRRRQAALVAAHNAAPAPAKTSVAGRQPVAGEAAKVKVEVVPTSSAPREEGPYDDGEEEQIERTVRIPATPEVAASSARTFVPYEAYEAPRRSNTPQPHRAGAEDWNDAAWNGPAPAPGSAVRPKIYGERPRAAGGSHADYVASTPGPRPTPRQESRPAQRTAKPAATRRHEEEWDEWNGQWYPKSQAGEW